MASETEIERMVVRLMGDNKQYIQSLKTAERMTSQFAMNVGKKMQSVGRSMSMALTAPLAIVGGLSVKAFGDFDQAMTESTAIMKTTEEQSERMAKQALELSKGKALQGPKELAESYFFLASAGKDAEQSMALLPKVASFATAGAFDMSTATDLLTDAQSALGMSSKDVAQDTKNLVTISDTLVKANTLANASVQQFSEALTSDAATASKQINAELSTTVSILALYADKGKKAAEAGNLYGRAVRLLTKSARDNAAAFEKYNVKAIDEATGEYRNFIDIIDDMNVAFEGMTGPEIGAALSELGFEALAQKSILPLLNATDQLKEYERQLKEAGGTTDAVANKQMKSFWNQLKLIGNQVKVFAIEVGELLAPTVVWLGNVLKKAISYWDGLSDGMKSMIVNAGLIVAAIGPILMGFGLFITLAVPAITAVGTAIAWLGATIGALSVPIIALGGVLVAWYAVVIDYFGGIQNIFNSAKNAVISFYNFVKPVVVQFGNLITTVFSMVWEFATGVFELIGNYIGETFAGAGTTIASFATDARDTFLEILIGIEFALKNATTIWDYFVTTVMLRLEQVKNEAWYVFATVIPKVLMWVGNLGFQIFTGLADVARKSLGNIASNLVNVMKNITGIIKGELSVADVWKPLEDGLFDTLLKLPDIPPREIGAIEQGLQLAVDAQAGGIAKDFEKFRKQRMKELGPQKPEVKEAVKDANEKTEEAVAAAKPALAGLGGPAIDLTRPAQMAAIAKKVVKDTKLDGGLGGRAAAKQGSSETASRLTAYRQLKLDNQALDKNKQTDTQIQQNIVKNTDKTNALLDVLVEQGKGNNSSSVLDIAFTGLGEN